MVLKDKGRKRGNKNPKSNTRRFTGRYGDNYRGRPDITSFDYRRNFSDNFGFDIDGLGRVEVNYFIKQERDGVKKKINFGSRHDGKKFVCGSIRSTSNIVPEYREAIKNKIRNDPKVDIKIGE